MELLQIIILAAVQGLTEFLPVSSSGHLVLMQTLLGVHVEGVVFEVAVHLATLVSVLIFYRAKIWSLIQGVLTGQRDAFEYVAKLGVATAPAAVLVLAAGDFLEAQFESPQVAAICLLVTGAILWTTRTTTPSARLEAPSYAAAFWIGCAQACAILPGISRSGSTVAAALALGVAPVAAAEFSFLMSVIAVGAAAARSLPELTSVPSEEVGPILAGGFVAGVAGLAAIWLFVRMLKSMMLHLYSYYTWAVGLAFLVGLNLL